MTKLVKMESLSGGSVTYWRTYEDARNYWRSMNGVRATQHHYSHHADMEVWRSMDGKAEAVQVEW